VLGCRPSPDALAPEHYLWHVPLPESVNVWPAMGMNCHEYVPGPVKPGSEGTSAAQRRCPVRKADDLRRSRETLVALPGLEPGLTAENKAHCSRAHVRIAGSCAMTIPHRYSIANSKEHAAISNSALPWARRIMSAHVGGSGCTLARTIGRPVSDTPAAILIVSFRFMMMPLARCRTQKLTRQSAK